MKPAVGERVTVMIDGEARRATVCTVPGATDAHAFMCELEVDPLRSYGSGQVVALVDTEGAMWARGWDQETAGALRATFALSDLSDVDKNLLLGALARRAASRASRRP